MSPRWTSVVAIMAVTALSIGVNGCGPRNGRPSMGSPEVGVVTIHPQSVTLTSELPGRTSPYAISEVRPQVSGIILKRLFTEGSQVKAGQTLYQIDPKPYQAAYDSARANLAATKAKANRYAALLKENAIAQQTYDDAQAAYLQAAAAVETARINLGYTRVKAAISGRIGISNVTAGALVTANQTNTLTTIQTLNPVYVDIAQSSTQLLELQRAVTQGRLDQNAKVIAKVSLTLEDGTRYPLEGTLQFTDVTVEPSTGSVTLRALFPNPKHVLLPGMFVRAKIVEGIDPHALLAPQQGVSRDTTGEPIAWVVGKNNKAELRTLSVSRAIGNKWLVTAGLSDGDRLIVQGVQKIRPGVTVRPVPVDLSAKPKTQPGH